MFVIVSLGQQKIIAVRLGQSAVTVGRNRDCDIVLPLPEISRVHAIIQRQGDVVRAENHGRNGILFKGERVPVATIRTGESIEIASYTLTVVSNTATVGAAWDDDKQTFPAGSVSGITGFCEMIGSSPPMQDLYKKIREAAPSQSAVLIVGETGTGKELVARALHSLSPTWSGPWIAVNCAAISPELVESELFGHERGAFTGAVARTRGAFEAAHGGTLFLDEIGEMPVGVQPKLLRVLEDHVFTRVGAREPIHVDIRVVAATNRNLADAAARGQFRLDLYHRLCVVPILVPPLRDRGEDIVVLARHFLAEAGPLPPILSPEAIDHLRAYAWPGNIRELRNVTRRILASHDGRVVDLPRLRTAIDSGLLATLTGNGGFDMDEDSVSPIRPDVLGEGGSTGESLEDSERKAIARALEASPGNRRAAAKRLGIAPSTLYAKMKKYGLQG